MSDPDEIPLEKRVFDLAKHFVFFRHQAEAYWCDADAESDRPGPDLDHMGLTAARLKATALSVAARVDPGPAGDRLRELDAAVERFWLHFRQAFRGSRRAERVEVVQKTDPEFVQESRRYLLKQSPLSSRAWGKLQTAVEAVGCSLEAPLRGCLEISLMLGSEIYPTITGGQGEREPEAELGYLAVDFAARVRDRLKALAESFPCLSRIELDLSNETRFSASGKINRLWQQIGVLLLDPCGAPGYLDLVLDRNRRRVGRKGQFQELRSPTRWDVLILLERSGSEPCTREQLEQVLGRPNETVNPNAVDKAISDLRPVLTRLSIRIESDRNIGFHLEDAECQGNERYCTTASGRRISGTRRPGSSVHREWT